MPKKPGRARFEVVNLRSRCAAQFNSDVLQDRSANIGEGSRAKPGRRGRWRAKPSRRNASN